jgi:hypothetical protein
MYYEAIFNPCQPNDYNHDALSFVGKKIALQDGWIIKNGPHKGQHCFYLPESTVGTIPASDLENLKSIPYVQWKTIFDQIGL